MGGIDLLKPVFGRFVFVGLLLLACVTQAQEVTFVAGKDYKILSTPAPVADPSRIEVVEVFWYGCPHCRNLNPLITQWEKQLADDVSFELLPSAGNRASRVHAKAFYAARALGVKDTMHDALFNALALDKKPLGTEDRMIEFFVAQTDVDESTVRKVFGSVGIQTRVEAAYKRAIAYQAQYVPALVINGKYRVDSGDAGSFPRMLAIADYLIDKERQQKP